jgi:hypothetical protein
MQPSHILEVKEKQHNLSGELLDDTSQEPLDMYQKP